MIAILTALAIALGVVLGQPDSSGLLTFLLAFSVFLQSVLVCNDIDKMKKKLKA